MAVAEYMVRATSTVTSRLWHVRGVMRLANLANRGLRLIGDNPIIATRLQNGARLLLDMRSAGQWYSIYSRRSDAYWTKLCADLLDEDQLFLDIGANIGMYAVQVMHLKGNVGLCHAFEPMPGNVARLTDNVALNQQQGVVTIHPYGLSDAPATLQLAFVAADNGEDTGNAEIIDAAAAVGRATFAIEVRCLDDVALPNLPIGVIKIDVEGHEDCAYRGGAKRLRKDRPFIIAEYNREELASRGLGPELQFGTHLPPDYYALRRHARGGGLIPIDDWLALPRLDNVLLCPAEKMARLHALGLMR